MARRHFSPSMKSIVDPPLSKAILLIAFSLFISTHNSSALGQVRYVETNKSPGSFSIVEDKVAAILCVDSNDHAGVVRAVKDLQTDVARVTDSTPVIVHEEKNFGTNAIIVGTIGK